MLGVTIPMLHMLGSAVVKQTAGRLNMMSGYVTTYSHPPVLPGPHAVQVAPGLEVDLVVEGDHDEDRQPERHARGHDGVGRVDDEPALLRVLVLIKQVLAGGVPAQEDGQEGDAGGREPGQQDHHHGRPYRDRGVIHQGLGNGVISKMETVKYWKPISNTNEGG